MISGLQGFAKFCQLVRLNHNLESIGFSSKVSVGDINRFNSRVKLARNFRGIDLEGYNPETISGYDGFFQVFLTHSALERFLKINSLNLHELETWIAPYHPEKVIQEFVDKDPAKLLYKFLYKHLDKERQKTKLSDCRNFKNKNLAYISASIRHIFAHGHLCANSNKIKPENVNMICVLLSDFLIDFMDAEFTKKIEDYYAKNIGSIES
jgi:hypothetical protein